MAGHWSNQSPAPVRGWSAYFVLGTGLILTAIATFLAWDNVLDHERTHFEASVATTREAIEDRLVNYADVLYGMRAFLQGGPISAQRFRDYVNDIQLETRYPGIQGTGFIQPLSGVLSQPKHTIRETENGECDYPRATARDTPFDNSNFIVQFAEPKVQDQIWSGVDVGELAPCRIAMRRALDTNKLAMTPLMTLQSGDDKAHGFGLLLPVYEPRRPLNTRVEREAALVGFVFSNFVGNHLFQGIFGGRALASIDFEVFADGTPNAASLYYDDDAVLHAIDPDYDAAFTSMERLSFGGETWSLHFSAPPGFHNPLNRMIGPMVFGIGLGLSLLAFSISRAQTERLRERHEHNAVLAFQANHDSLTLLPNRDALLGRLHSLQHSSDGRPFALLVIDLDRFKEINDALGHDSGDQLLRLVAPRLQDLAEPADMVARLGGDEFALVINPLPGREAAVVRARRILERIHEPFDLDNISLQIDASIGISLYPDHGSDTRTLLRHADVAMYIAKHTDQDYALYDAALDRHSPRRLQLLSELGGAVERNELVLHFQPKIDLADRSVNGVEALVRWHHPAEGMIPPGDFIPQAEMSPLIRPLTLWVVEAALRQCRQWQQSGIRLQVAVNVSARNLMDAELPEKIAQLLRICDVNAECLEFEVTESAVIADPEQALKTLVELHKLGIQSSLDDFGTGFTSMSHLRRLPLTRIKIDRSFVTDMDTNDNDAVIVRSTVNLAHSLGLTVVAEGVETESVLSQIEMTGCDQVQGFLICRPLPAEELRDWLANRTHSSA